MKLITIRNGIKLVNKLKKVTKDTDNYKVTIDGQLSYIKENDKIRELIALDVINIINFLSNESKHIDKSLSINNYLILDEYDIDNKDEILKLKSAQIINLELLNK